MQILFKIAGAFPLPLLRALGWVLGWVSWMVSARYRHLFYSHWAGAMQHLGLSQKRRGPEGLWASIGQAGQLISELPKIWCAKDLSPLMRIEGLEACQRAYEEGRGLIFLTPHLGAFELAPRVLGLHFPITILYRPARQASVENLYVAFRPSAGVTLAQANSSGVRKLMRALKSGEAIGMLPDQVPTRGEGLWSPFMGRLAYTMTLPARLALLTRAPVVWTLVLREPSGWRLVFHIWTPPVLDDPSDALQATVDAMNAQCESLVRRAPSQYLWAYNRYKKPAGVEAPATP
ncbi:MAG: lysophospholipid acyltransferase family protein [Betaproteobacteria bacterium]|nr:lysophospholipid acyltransferase family protein [Betaproteobacteria bacterium]NBT75376.1 lysophospholipid acyltransferase family protein [Betaproteobacteria bacterium]NCA15937.1 lysophospholipid acyltransferase family protein [Betaproteobacteria bacterium]